MNRLAKSFPDSSAVYPFLLAISTPTFPQLPYLSGTKTDTASGQVRMSTGPLYIKSCPGEARNRNRDHLD